MWPVNRPWGIGAKLAALYALLFAASIALLGTMALYVIDTALRGQIDSRIREETAALIAGDGTPGALATRIGEKISGGGPFSYRLEDQSGVTISGDIPVVIGQTGWSDFDTGDSGSDEQADQFRALGTATGDGLLIVAEDTDIIENVWTALAGATALVALASGVLACGGGFWLSRLYLRRLDQFADRARAITAGDLAQRMPRMRTGDEFDSLSTSLNTMLDRNQDLFERQRQVTSDIAHDIRTPLARLRQKLEAGLRDKSIRMLPQAITETDHLLEILGSLLRIAEIEEGSQRNHVTDIDLGQIAAKVVEIYQPAFEESGRSLVLVDTKAVAVIGDGELLTQLLVNLVENSLVHTPVGAYVEVEARTSAQGSELVVRDNGDGVPPGEEGKILERFYRLDRSRSTVGCGLGLSLVKAIADWHRARLSVENLAPGLAISVTWKHPPTVP